MAHYSIPTKQTLQSYTNSSIPHSSNPNNTFLIWNTWNCC